MRIAIVGAGVSGLVAAHLLHREHEIVVYEADAYAGGHTNTIRVDTEHQTHHVDTGLHRDERPQLPDFTRLLDRLGVARQPTHMSFSVKGEEQDFEYSGTPRGLFCQPRNLASPRFQRMIVDLLRFNRALRALLERRGKRRVAGRLPRAPPLLARVRRAADRAAGVRRVVGRPAQGRLVPGALHRRVLRQPRHARLPRPPSWSTVAGGSARYVEALTAPFRERIRLRTPVSSITRRDGDVEILAAGSAAERYRPRDRRHALRPGAAHARATRERERELLGAIPYQPNEAVLHTDSTLLPRRRAARSAWNFHLLREPKPLSTVTYYMNHLQRLDADRDFCVTLNRTEAIDPAKIIRTIPYSHPCTRRAASPRRPSTRRSAVWPSARTTAAPTGAGAFTRTASSARCAPARRSG